MIIFALEFFASSHPSSALSVFPRPCLSVKFPHFHLFKMPFLPHPTRPLQSTVCVSPSVAWTLSRPHPRPICNCTSIRHARSDAEVNRSNRKEPNISNQHVIFSKQQIEFSGSSIRHTWFTMFASEMWTDCGRSATLFALVWFLFRHLTRSASQISSPPRCCRAPRARKPCST